MTDLEAMKAPRVLVELPPHERTSLEEEGELADRTKREVTEELRIETAVFVDDDMVTFIKERYPRLEVKETITDTVFAIMNGVSVLLCSVALVLHEWYANSGEFISALLTCVVWW